MRNFVFIFLVVLVSCASETSKESESYQVLEENKSLDELRKELLLELSNKYYPEFDFSEHNFISDTISRFFATYPDTIDSNYYNHLDGPLIAFYENGEPELLRMYKDNDYYGWEFWFDSLGVIEETKLRFPKPLGDEGKIKMYRKFDKKGRVINEKYVKIEGDDKLLNLKVNSSNTLRLEWGCNDSDSLAVSYRLFYDRDSTDFIYLNSFKPSDSAIVLPKLDSSVKYLQFKTNACYSSGKGSFPAFINKKLKFISN